MSASPLTERLLARANEPLGLIDVRAARARYERLMDWVAARLALVEELRARYGLTEEAAWGELAFAVTPGQLRGESFDSAGDGAALSHDLTHTIGSVDRTRATAAEGTTRTPESSTSTPASPQAATHATVRIGRRGAPVFSQLDRVTDAREGGQTHELKSGDGESHGASETKARHMSLSPSRPSTPSAESSPASLSSPASPTFEAPVASSDERTTPAPERRELTLARTAEVSASAAEASEARKARRESVPVETAHPLPSKEAANTRAPKVVAASPRAVESSPTPSTRMVSSHPADLPLATPAAPDEAAARRRTEGKEPGAETGAMVKAVETSAVRGGGPPPRASAKEIAPAVAGRESLTYSTQSPMPLAASRGVGERTASPTPQHTFAESGAQAFKPPAGGVEDETYPAAREQKRRAAEVNVGRLAEQVSRRLTRRLLVERERRGMK
jgi:hypothetical protein